MAYISVYQCPLYSIDSLFSVPHARRKTIISKSFFHFIVSLSDNSNKKRWSSVRVWVCVITGCWTNGTMDKRNEWIKKQQTKKITRKGFNVSIRWWWHVRCCQFINISWAKGKVYFRWKSFVIDFHQRESYGGLGLS